MADRRIGGLVRLLEHDRHDRLVRPSAAAAPIRRGDRTVTVTSSSPRFASSSADDLVSAGTRRCRRRQPRAAWETARARFASAITVSTASHSTQPSEPSTGRGARSSAAVIDGSSAITLSRFSCATFILMPTRCFSVQAPRDQDRRAANLGLLPLVCPRLRTGDQHRVADQQFLDDAQTVGARRDPVSVTSTAASTIPSATLASVAPQENSTHRIHLALSQGSRDELDHLAWQIRLPSRSSMHGDSAGRRHAGTQREGVQRGLGVDEALNLLQVDVVLDQPVAAGDSGVERAVGDVPRHLLGRRSRQLSFGSSMLRMYEREPTTMRQPRPARAARGV